jgi:hypothetical protein
MRTELFTRERNGIAGGAHRIPEEQEVYACDELWENFLRLSAKYRGLFSGHHLMLCDQFILLIQTLLLILGEIAAAHVIKRFPQDRVRLKADMFMIMSRT